MKDISNIKKNKSLEEQERIFCIFSEKDMHDVKALIIGPKDTPYENGYFFFELHFPKNYPHKPPSALLKTLAPGVRFNPNLYTEGKVCLSILGTWSGPSWTVCQSMTSVLHSIQSLMSDKPYVNEPGYENANKNSIDIYNQCIDYHTFRVAIVQQLEKPVAGYEEFLPIMEKIFMNDYDRLMTRIKKLAKKMQGKNITAPSPFSYMIANCDYKSLITKMEAIYKRLSEKYPDMVSEENKSKNKFTLKKSKSTSDLVSEENKSKKKFTLKKSKSTSDLDTTTNTTTVDINTKEPVQVPEPVVSEVTSPVENKKTEDTKTSNGGLFNKLSSMFYS